MKIGPNRRQGAAPAPNRISRLILIAAAVAASTLGAPPLRAQTPNGTCIRTLGDSLTSGYQRFLSRFIPDRKIVPGGLGAQTSTQIAARAGAIPTRVFVPGDSLPRSGTVQLASIQPRLISSSNKADEIEGSLAGRPGRLTRDASDRYDFVLNPADRETPAPPGSLFAPQTSDVDKCVLVLWAGRNDIPASATILANIDAILEPYVLRRAPFLVISVLNSDSEPAGSARFAAVMRINQTLAQKYPSGFLDVRRYLMDSALADAKLPADDEARTWLAKDLIPASLRKDGIHLKDEVDALVAKFIASAIKNRQW